MALFDLVRPQWKHSDPARRAEAMRLLEDDRQDVFLPAALEDDSVEVRLAAARRLQGEEALRKALNKATARAEDKSVRDVLHKMLIPVVVEKAASTRTVSDAEASAWTAELAGWAGGEKALEELALGAVAPVVRRAALTRLNHASGILAVALKETDPAVALDAFARLSREAHYEAVAKGAKTREARGAAKDKLRALEDAKKPDAVSLGRAKLSILIYTAERAEAGCVEPGLAFDWESAREHVEDAVRAFETLVTEGIHASAAERAQFAASVSVFRNRHATHVATETARRARDEDEARIRTAREEVCTKLEALYADPRPVDGAEVETLTREFHAIRSEVSSTTNASTETDPSQERFRIVRERLRDRVRTQREAVDAVRNAESAAQAEQRATQRAAEQVAEAERLAIARIDAAPALEAVITELEALVSSADQKTADKRLRDLQAKGKNLLSVLGEEAQGAALRYHAAADQVRETLEWSRWSNLQRKQALIEQLEALAKTVSEIIPNQPAEATPENTTEAASGTNPEAATSTPSHTKTPNAPSPEATRPLFARFKDLLGEWKAVGPVTWDATEATWDRYHTVADSLYEKFRGFFAELDEEREANFKAKDELCAKLEVLMASPEADSRETSEAFREAHGAWKALGAVPREKADALWDRFRAVNKAYQDKREGVFKENLAAKRILLARVEELKDSTSWKSAATGIKEAQEQWKTIGPVPRDKAEALWNRFHAACEAFFTARRAYFEQLDAERPINLEKKTALCERVEKLDELPGDRERYEAILDVQAQWKEIGPVPREQEDALWERFRKPLDAYFEAHRERTAGERALREVGAKAKEELCAEAETLLAATLAAGDGANWKVGIEQVKALQARWKDSPPAPRNLDQALWKRFRTACDGFFEKLKERGAERDRALFENLALKRDFCFAVEIYAGLAPADEDARAARDAWLEAQRTAGHGVPDDSGDWASRAEKVKALQREWREIGPAPRAENDVIWTRFQKASDLFFEEARRAENRPGEDAQHNLEDKLTLIARAEELALDPARRHEGAVDDLRREWRRIGPVPRAQSGTVWDRFNSACEAAVPRKRA
jgi:hypothetical protein